MTTPSPLILGTRGSRLALIQTEAVLGALRAAFPGIDASLKVIKTSGDWKPEDGEKRLSEADGGKGLFVKEIEQAVLAAAVHAGVHSLKDVPSFLPMGAQVAHVLERANPMDVFISRTGDDLMALPSGSVVGTSSLRRQAIVKKLRPDLVVVPLRGNVPTRLDKVRSGQVDAAILAAAGLDRLGPDAYAVDLTYTKMDPALMLPACGQGIIGIETRTDDTDTLAVMDKINHMPTCLCAAAERQVLQILDGDCHTPIGAFATLQNEHMYIRAMVATPDGHTSYQAERQGSVKTVDDALALAQDLGMDVRGHAPQGLLPQRRTGT